MSLSSTMVDVVEYAASHPFEVVTVCKHENTSKNQTPGVVESEYSSIGFVLSASGHPGVISPEYVGTIVLKHLLKLTAMHLKYNQVNKAVMTVPAKFSSIQRAATGLAFRDAGLKVVRVLDEPTAAAVAYNLHKNQNIHHILVYDFGGGTLDVSILYVSQGSVEVYATDGDNFLGGSDFDMCLHDHIRSRVFEQTDGAVWLDSLNSTNLGHGNPSEELSKDSVLGCNSAAIRKDIENLKKQLSMEFIVTFQCVYDHGKSNKHIISLDVSRTDFEMSCEHLFNRSLIPVNRILDDLGMVGLSLTDSRMKPCSDEHVVPCVLHTEKKLETHTQAYRHAYTSYNIRFGYLITC